MRILNRSMYCSRSHSLASNWRIHAVDAYYRLIVRLTDDISRSITTAGPGCKQNWFCSQFIPTRVILHTYTWVTASRFKCINRLSIDNPRHRRTADAWSRTRFPCNRMQGNKKMTFFLFINIYFYRDNVIRPETSTKTTPPPPKVTSVQVIIW